MYNTTWKDLALCFSAADDILICGMSLGYEDEKALVNSYRTPREEVETFTRYFE